MNAALFDKFLDCLVNLILNSDVDDSEFLTVAIEKTDGLTNKIFLDWMKDSNFSKLYTSKLVDLTKVKSFPRLLSSVIRDTKKPLDAIKFLSDSKNTTDLKPSEKSFSIATLDYLRAVQSLIIHPDDANLKKFDEEAKYYQDKFETYRKERLNNFSTEIGGTKE